MHYRHESQPFQLVRQINSFSPSPQPLAALRELSDIYNIPNQQ